MAADMLSLFQRRPHPAALNPPDRPPGVACFYLADLPFWTAAQHHPDPDNLVVHAAGRLIACSQALHALGLSHGDPLDRVQRLAPQAQLTQRDPGREELAAEAILRRLNARTPRVERLVDRRLQGLWIILSGLSPAEVQRLAAQSGGQLGLATHRSLAMLAALTAPPGQARIVRPEATSHFLSQVPLRQLAPLGFSLELRQALDFLGLFRLGDCLDLSQSQLQARFGREGQALYRLLHPCSYGSAAAFSPTAISVRRELEWPTSEPVALLPVLLELVEQGRQQLGARLCRAVTLRLWLRGGTVQQQQVALKTASSSSQVLGYRLERLLRLLLTSSQEVHCLELCLHRLTPALPPQHSLFANRKPISDILGSVERRFPGKLLQAVTRSACCFPEEAFALVPRADTSA